MKNNLLKISAYFICLIIVSPAIADSISVNFENPPYVTGTINNQDGWISLGSIGSGCAVYDHVIATNSYGYSTFASQSLRISDAVTSGCFSDQTFSKPLINSVGETSAFAGSFPEGTRQSHFEMQFDIASTQPTQQPGMHVSVSPDRGDGSRMSYLGFEDNANGIDVIFYDYQLINHDFVKTIIATGLDRAIPHTVKLTLDVIDGPSNDIVKVYIDGSLITANGNSCATGTSWEDYYQDDINQSSEPGPRIVRTVLFRSSGTANTNDTGKGFLFDNLSLLSGPTGSITPQGCDISVSSSPIPTMSEWALIILSVIMAITIGLTARVRHS